MKDTSTIGTIGELAVTSHLLSLGYSVYKDVTGASPIDLIAYRNRTCIRIQVKCHTSKNGTVGFSRYVGGREVKKQLTGNEFDIMAVYVRDRNLCLFMRLEELIQNGRGMVVRFEPAKNGVKKNIRWYEKYLTIEMQA